MTRTLSRGAEEMTDLESAGLCRTPLERAVAAICEAGETPDRLPVLQPFCITGTFRVHFNRHGAAPLVWTVATEHFELAVSVLDIRVPLRSVYAPKATPDDEDGVPSAWFEVTGRLELVGSTAVIA